MKIFKVYMYLGLVLSRLKKYKLDEYAYENPIIFVPANDPDDACHQAYIGLSEKIIKQGLYKTNGYYDVNILEFTKDILNDISIMRVGVANEKKL
jgi:hypothetical protein